MKRMLDFISPWALAGIALWIAVVGLVADREKYAFVNIGEGPCGDPCVFVPPPIDWLPVLGLASAVATIVIAALTIVVVMVRHMSQR